MPAEIEFFGFSKEENTMITKVQAWILMCGFVMLLAAGSGLASASCVSPIGSKTGCAQVKDAGKPEAAACRCCQCTPCTCQKCECCKCAPCACK
jgi:hypothetical protein